MPVHGAVRDVSHPVPRRAAGHGAKGGAKPRRIGVDETSFRKRHRYVTPENSTKTSLERHKTALGPVRRTQTPAEAQKPTHPADTGVKIRPFEPQKRHSAKVSDQAKRCSLPTKIQKLPLYF